MVETHYECGECRDRPLGLSILDRAKALSLRNKGFALVSMIIILALMGIAAGVATSFAHKLKTSRKQLATEDELQALKEAIIGNPRQFSKQGRSNFGYLGDMGGLPGALADLYTKGTQPDYALGAAGQGAGWAGPYITPILREDLSDLLKDAFNNTYAYTTTAYQRASDNEWVSARIRSFGTNKTDDNGTGDDKQVEILRKETISTVSGRVTDSAGTGISGATVTLYYPVAGSVSNPPLVTTTDAGGHYAFPANAVPYGVRTITATASPTGTLLYADGSALAFTASQPNSLSFNVTNWGAAAITVTSVRLEYTFTPTGYYEEAYAGGAQIFKYNDATIPNYNSGNRRGTGDTLTFPSPVSISGGSGASTTTRILVSSDNVQVPDIVLSPTGGGTLNFRYLTFMRNQSGGGPRKDVDNEQFTATLYNGATPVNLGPVHTDDPSETFTAREED